MKVLLYLVLLCGSFHSANMIEKKWKVILQIDAQMCQIDAWFSPVTWKAKVIISASSVLKY